MIGISNTSTARRPGNATGLIYFKALIDHAIEHGLPAPSTIEITDRHIRVWLTDGHQQWGETITVDAVDTRPSPIAGRVIVYVDGRLPFMNLAVQLAFSQAQLGAPALTVVSS